MSNRSNRNRNVNSRKRRLKSRRRQIVMRNRMILAGVILLLLIIIFALILKGCNGKGKGSDADKKTENETLNNATESVTSDTSLKDNKNVTSKGFVIEQIDGCTYIDGVLIANKTYALPKSFVPTNPYVPVTSDTSTTSLDKTLMKNWTVMQKDAWALGLNIYISSGYRSYERQQTIYDSYVAKDGKVKADTYSSRAGHSEHQTGLCFDLNTIEDSFQYTKEGKWVNDNCYKYGFCIRFPKGKEDMTGYQYESWHLRYVGVELATKLYNNGDWLSLEEYFGITSEYGD